jgi:uncharacterized protein
MENMPDISDVFRNQSYLNIETFRKNGQGVKTPVWFIQDGAVIYIRTIANSGKVKRLRNNPQARIAPCRMDGTLLGEWITAVGQEVSDPETGKHVDRLLGKKYGLQKNLFAWASRIRGDRYTILQIDFSKN